MTAIRSGRALSSLGQRPRHQSDQSGLPDTVEEGTIILGRQPDEEPPPEPAPEEPPPAP